MTDKQKVQVLAIALLATVVVAAAVIYWYSVQLTIHNTGRIRTFGVGAFKDQACTELVSAIDWGSMDPGMTKAVQIYLKNNGTDPGVLSMNTSAWQPAIAAEFLNLTWTAEGRVLQPDQVIAATFLLHVSPDITGIHEFEFDINVFLGEQPPA